MRTQTSSRFRRIRLDSIAFINKVFIVNLFKQPPYTFHVFWLISDIWIFHIHPITHLLCEIIPNICIAHDGIATCFIIVFYTYFFTNVFFGDSQLFLHTQFNRKTMCIPTCFTFYLKSFLSFKTAKNIFNSTPHYMVYPRHTVCRWRSFKKDIRLLTFTTAYTLFKNVIFFPISKNFFSYFRKVKSFIFRELCAHFTRFLISLRN